MSDLGQDLFAGGRRRAQYDEPTTPVGDRGATMVEDQRPAGADPKMAGPGAVEGLVVPPSTDVMAFGAGPNRAEPSAGAFRSFLAKLGVVKAAPSAEQVADTENERVIRQATWTRAVNVIVANRKGSSLKTPATILLAGALADIRGGYVVAWEASESPGDLAERAEGTPPRGLTELLAAAELVTSAGNLAGYTAPQTSHAAVIGTVSARAALGPEDVLTARRLIDAYYHISIADTANNELGETFLAALDTADAALVPCTLNLQSIRGAQRAVQTIAGRTAPHVRGLRSRTVVVVSHDGGPEDPQLAASVVDGLRSTLGVQAVIEVPFDPAIRRDGEITYADLSPASRLAWRRIGRCVVDALQDAPEQSPIPPSPKES